MVSHGHALFHAIDRDGREWELLFIATNLVDIMIEMQDVRLAVGMRQDVEYLAQFLPEAYTQRSEEKFGRHPTTFSPLNRNRVDFGSGEGRPTCTPYDIIKSAEADFVFFVGAVSTDEQRLSRLALV